ncbi:MAG: DUF2807 domain-containing protein [Prevotellaceae bacterium]|jgi:hypothetical protein|nr:DUF2807 domain-containing protein [Prevotellaceae bacterium]
MKKIFLTTALFCFAIITTCFAQRDVVSEERSVGSFDKINSCCGIDVYITEGTLSTLKVETNYEEMLDEIITRVKDDELEISLKRNNRKGMRNLKMKVYVSATGLKLIDASSGSDIYSTNQLNTDNIELSASSGADITLDLKADNINCKATSGSDIKLKGTAQFAKLRANSGADIKMRDMTVARADAKASSGSDIVLYVTDELDANASSGADITYYGNPKNVNKRASSRGDITRKN